MAACAFARRILLALGALALCASPPSVGAAAKTPAARRAPAKTDFTGVWFPYQPEGFDFLPLPVLTPAADKLFKQTQAQQAKGVILNDTSGRCIPSGIPRLLNRVYPMRIIQTPKDIVALHEYESQMRFIHMDGRRHPQGDDLIPTFNGHSIGHWEGKVLVIDSVGFKTEVAGWPTQPMNGIRITDAYHVVERWSLGEGGKLLTIDLTITDPPVFAQPWKTMKRFKRRDDLELMEYTCLPDENPIALDAEGRNVFKAPSAGPQAPAGR